MLKLIKNISLFIALCLVSFTALATDTNSNFSDSNKAIMVSQQNPQFTLTLPSNPTTGFTWLVDKYDPDFVTVVGHQYQAPQTKMIGAGGVDVWTFKVNSIALTAPHLLKITMLYTRAWDAQQAGKKVEFTIATH